MDDFSSMPDGFDSSKAGFNEAAYIMVRLHHIQTAINQARLNPLASDPQTGTPYYQLWFSCLNSLYSEISGKLIDKEQKELKAYQLIIKNSLHKNPIFKQRRSSIDGSIKTLFNQQSWNEIEHLLMKYEERLKFYKEEKGLGNPGQGTQKLFG